MAWNISLPEAANVPETSGKVAVAARKPDFPRGAEPLEASGTGKILAVNG